MSPSSSISAAAEELAAPQAPAAGTATAERGKRVVAAGPAIVVRGVGKCYEIYARPLDRLKQTLYRGRRRFYREFWALQDASLEIEAGEAIGIVGRNGSGKSTLLQIIAGTLRPSTGDVTVRGRVHALLELGSGFNPEFTGRENVYLNGAVLGLSRRQIDAKFDEIAAFADIGEFLDQPIKTYSTGMVVRLAFAVQVQLEPNILIVDEALSVGDMAFQQKCMSCVRRLLDNGTTFLFVSHDPYAIRTLCRRALWLDRGRVAGLGSANEVTEAYLSDLRVGLNARALQEWSGPAVSPEVLTPLEEAAQTLDGGQAARLRSVRLLNELGQATEALRLGERFTVECELEADVDLVHVSVGFVLKDRLGVELTGESVFNSCRRGFTIQKGQTRTVRFTGVNILRPGPYAIGAYVHCVSKWDRSDSLLLYADETALSFHTLSDPSQPVWFQFRQPFEVSIR
jgi:lipopolysaccharide transport system ATP-binding protein